ncbi:CCR4-NOT transcription complex subunit 11 [Umbelopsis sp. WA50703]
MDTLNEHQPERLVVQCILSGATEPLQSFSAVELVDNLDRSIPIATVDVQRLHNLQVIEQQLVGLGGDSQLAGIAHTHAHLSTKQHQKHNVTIDPTLMNAAFTSPLSIAQQETLLHMIESDPENLKNHLPLDQLPDLIEQNQAIAIEALNVLAETPEFSEYLQTILTIEVTSSTMEVVHRLLIGNHRKHIPDEFMHIYLSNCIRSCEVIDDRSLQSRQVRLVSVFVQSLIRNDIINISDFLLEIQSFCIEFSRHRGATSLFQIVAEQTNKHDFILSPPTGELGDSTSMDDTVI